MTKAQVNREIKRLEPGMSTNSDSFLAYQVLLAAAVVGPRQQDILRFIKTRRWQKAVTFIERARRNRIFIGDKISSEIYSDGVGLALGVNVLQGFIRRTKVNAA